MNQTIRQKIEQLFELPMMKMPWSLYMAQLNESGKLTARSIMDILTVVLEDIEEMEKEENLKVPETTGEILNIINPEVFPKEEPKTTSKKISKITTESIGKTLPEAILGDKPPKLPIK